MDISAAAHAAFICIAGVIGLVFGSFVTALSYRLPRGESIARGRSRCPTCTHVLTVRDLVPLLSWLSHFGKCRHCGAPVSRRYPAIEALSLVCFTVTAAAVRDPRAAVVALAFIPPLLAVAVIDFEHQTVPDSLVLALVPMALAWRWHTDAAVTAGLAAALAVLLGLIALGRLFRATTGGPGIGLGDVKLIALAAFAFPLFDFFAFLAAASFSGLFLGVWWRRRTGQERFPFAVNIALAWWLCLIVPAAAVLKG